MYYLENLRFVIIWKRYQSIWNIYFYFYKFFENDLNWVGAVFEKLQKFWKTEKQNKKKKNGRAEPAVQQAAQPSNQPVSQPRPTVTSP